MSLGNLLKSSKTLTEARLELAPFVDQMDLGIELRDPANIQKVLSMADFVGFMPSEVSIEETAIAYLHYKICNTDYYIICRDRRDVQTTCGGVIVREARMPEHDLISVKELIRAGAKLDWDWRPAKLTEINLLPVD